MRLTARSLQMATLSIAVSIVPAVCVIAMSQTPGQSRQRSEEPEVGVRAMVFSPDGTTLAIIRGDLKLQKYFYRVGYEQHVNFYTHQSEVELWSVVENKLILKLGEFGGPIFLSGFSPDSKSFATVSWEAFASKPVAKQMDSYKPTGVLKLWDARTGGLRWSREAHSLGVSALTFYPDGNLIVSAGASYSYELRVWESQSGKEIRRIEYRARVTALAVSADGNTLAVTKAIYREPGNEIKVHDARTFKEQMTLKSEARKPFVELLAPCAFSPDGTILAVARSGVDRSEHFSEVELWDVRTRKPARTLTFNKSPVLPEELKVLTSFWGPYKQQFWFNSLRAKGLPVTSLVFSAQGNRLTTANGVKVMVWEPATGESILNGVSRRPATVTASDLTPCGETLAIADTGNQVSLLNVNTGKVTGVLALSDAPGTIDIARLVVSVEKIPSVAFYPDGKTIASAGSLLRLWDAQSGIAKLTLRGLESEVLSVAASSDARILVGACEDGKIRIWGAQTGKLEQTVSASSARVNSVAISPDGNLLAGGSDDSSVALWDARTGQPTLVLNGHTGPVTGVAFSPDGTLIATAGVDRSVKLWDVKSGEEVRALQGILAPVTTIAFSSSGTLATGSTDGFVKVWNARTGQLIETLSGHQGQVNSVAFSPGGEVVASGGDDKTVRLWDARTGKRMRKLEGHGAAIFCLAFSPDGKTLVAGTGDNTLVVWDSQSGALKRVIKEPMRIPVHRVKPGLSENQR